MESRPELEPTQDHVGSRTVASTTLPHLPLSFWPASVGQKEIEKLFIEKEVMESARETVKNSVGVTCKVASQIIKY